MTFSISGRDYIEKKQIEKNRSQSRKINIARNLFLLMGSANYMYMIKSVLPRQVRLICPVGQEQEEIVRQAVA
jgi:hypothetical protein